MKLCTKTTCKRHHDTKFKCCPTCRETSRRCQKKRKRIASQKKVEQGYKLCGQCLHIKPITQFESTVHRRKKLTTECTNCRIINKRKQEKPTSKTAQCKEFWVNWKKQQKCVDCGLVDDRVIQADHVRGRKIHRVGHYCWWVCNGGVTAMEEELKKCEARCSFCHNIKSKERWDNKRKMEGRTRNVTWKRRQHEINMVKCKIGECKHCERKVTMETCCGFDFDHRNEETKVMKIAKIPNRSEVEYRKLFNEEIPKCDLLCSNCHRIKTHYKK